MRRAPVFDGGLWFSEDHQLRASFSREAFIALSSCWSICWSPSCPVCMGSADPHGHGDGLAPVVDALTVLRQDGLPSASDRFGIGQPGGQGELIPADAKEGHLLAGGAVDAVQAFADDGSPPAAEVQVDGVQAVDVKADDIGPIHLPDGIIELTVRLFYA